MSSKFNLNALFFLLVATMLSQPAAAMEKNNPEAPKAAAGAGGHHPEGVDLNALEKDALRKIDLEDDAFNAWEKRDERNQAPHPLMAPYNNAVREAKKSMRVLRDAGGTKERLLAALERAKPEKRDFVNANWPE